jgi:hypothetical protein
LFDQFENKSYKGLNHLQVGRLGEYWVKLMLTLEGYDVYTSEVDDRGIDFIVRLSPEKYIDIQVKTIRGYSSYVFVDKVSKAWTTPLRNNLYLALVVLIDNSAPEMYLIPASTWNVPQKPFVSNDYVGSLKSKPDYGINISRKNMAALQSFRFPNPLNQTFSVNSKYDFLPSLSVAPTVNT